MITGILSFAHILSYYTTDKVRKPEAFFFLPLLQKNYFFFLNIEEESPVVCLFHATK